jgi:hypothetical protein
MDHALFRENDGWAGYVETKEPVRGQYRCDLTKMYFERDRLLKVLKSEN